MQMWQTGKLKRLNLLEGSVSSGKTWISLVLWAFWVASMPKDKQYIMCAYTLTSLKTNCLILLQELVGEDNFSFSMSQKEGWLFGRRVRIEGANDERAESKIRGATYQGAYVDEASKVPRGFFAMLLSRLRLPNAKLFATTNPENPSHWLKVDYIDRAEDLSFLDMKFLLDDNTTLPDEYVENIKREYTGVFYDRFILGKWVQAEGLIYPMWEDALEHPPTHKAEKYALSIDYGTQNAFAAILWGKYEDVWYAMKEYYYSGRATGIQKTDAEYGKDMDEFISCTDCVMETIIDPSAASFIALLRRKGGRYKVRKADNAVSDGIRDTATALKMHKIYISPHMKNWRDEAAGYSWDEKRSDDVPVKVNDHLMDAMRYFVKTKHIVRPNPSYVAQW